MRIAIYVIMLLAVAAAFAQYDEPLKVMDNGGGKISSGSYDNRASIGQSVICFSGSGSYDNIAGFIGD